MNIYEKLLAIQTELKAPKSQYNSFGKYYYRNCEDILEAVKPIAAKSKTVVTITDELVRIGERYYVKAVATLTDVEDCDYISNTSFAREEEEKKGMDGSQVTGAASSYARKYALNGLFAIDDTKDSDTTNTGDSGQTSSKKGATGTQRESKSETLTLEQAEKLCFKSGNYANKPFGDLGDKQLEWIAANGKNEIFRQGATMILDARQKQAAEDNEEIPFE